MLSEVAVRYHTSVLLTPRYFNCNSQASPRLCWSPCAVRWSPGEEILMRSSDIRSIKQFFAVVAIAGLVVWGCSGSQANGIDPPTVQNKYGLIDAHTENVMTPDGPIVATV